MLDHLRESDTLVVWKLDRLSRSLKDVLHIMEWVAEAGADFRSLTENIDTTTPAARLTHTTSNGTVKLFGCGRAGACDRTRHTEGYVRAATPVTSAHLWKAWVRMARYWGAER
jgi:resolvase-like protein